MKFSIEPNLVIRGHFQGTGALNRDQLVLVGLCNKIKMAFENVAGDEVVSSHLLPKRGRPSGNCFAFLGLLTKFL